MTTTITLNARELAHILTALRMTKDDLANRMGDMDIREIGPYFDNIPDGPLDDEGIDALCERINVEDAPPEQKALIPPGAKQAGDLDLLELMETGEISEATSLTESNGIVTYITEASHLGFPPSNWPSFHMWVGGHRLNFRPIRESGDGGRIYINENRDREIIVLND